MFFFKIQKILLCVPCFKCRCWRHPDWSAVYCSGLMFTSCSHQSSHLYLSFQQPVGQHYTIWHIHPKKLYADFFFFFFERHSANEAKEASRHRQRCAVAETGSRCQLVNNSQELSNTIRADWEGRLSGRLAGWQTACGGDELNNSLVESLAVRWVNKLQRGESNPQPSWLDEDLIKGFQRLRTLKRGATRGSPGVAGRYNLRE